MVTRKASNYLRGARCYPAAGVRMRSMKSKTFWLGALLLTVLLGGAGLSQRSDDPLEIGELFTLLWKFRQGQTTQQQIAEQVERRGIAFRPDASVLAELERQGAAPFLLEAIRQGGGPANLAEPDPLEERPPTENPSPDAYSDPRIEDLPLIEQARVLALEYTRALPNFIVSQKVQRYIQMPGNRGWQLQDTLEVELRYRNDIGEEFNLLRVNGRSTQRTYQQLGGSTSTGEFGSILAGAFAPQSETEFREVGSEVFRGRKTVIFEFNVLTRNSRSQITDRNTGRAIVSGYEGRLWIDAENGRVLRIEQSHNDIPRDFPVTLAENAVEYDWVEIAAQQYLLPVQAEMLLGEDLQSFYARNVIEFQNYRKFVVEVKIR